MNFFFGINNNYLNSELQIPTFQNRKIFPNSISLFKASIKNSKWELNKLQNNKINDNFHIIDENEVSNSDIYFLAEDKDISLNEYIKLQNFNSFTETVPAFRCNLKISITNGGFSSYQSEYPYSMVVNNGSILSSVNSLANQKAEKNYIFIRNIFTEPVYETFNAYFVNIKKRKIEEIFEIKTNYSNMFEINKKLIKPEIYLITKKYIGIPMYISIDNKHISFEHTHPPHEYILSENKFNIIKNLKKEINEIIY